MNHTKLPASCTCAVETFHTDVIRRVIRDPACPAHGDAKMNAGIDRLIDDIKGAILPLDPDSASFAISPDDDDVIAARAAEEDAGAMMSDNDHDGLG